MKTKEKLPTTWTTRDEGEVLIAEMEDRHLNNTIAMLQRKAQGIANQMLNRAIWAMLDADAEFDVDPGGAMARAAKDPKEAALWMKKQPNYRALVRERKRRKKNRRELDIIQAGEALVDLIMTRTDGLIVHEEEELIGHWRKVTVGRPAPGVQNAAPDVQMQYLGDQADQLGAKLSEAQAKRLINMIFEKHGPVVPTPRPFWVGDEFEHIDPYGDT